MPDPTDNDPWADLYADLGVTEKPARPAPAAHDDPAPADDAPEPFDGDESAESDDDSGDGLATGEPGELGEDGTPKKKRRRRRRGKKKPGEEGAAGAVGFDEDGPAGDEMPEYGRNAAPPVRELPREPARPQPRAARPPEDGNDDDGFGSGVEQGETPVEVHAADASLEGATNEMTRDLIANWNVPSWEELVRGLNRPNH